MDGPVSLTARAVGRHSNLRISGQVIGDDVYVNGLHGQGVAVDFTLRPAANTAAHQPSVIAIARVRQAQWNSTRFSDLQLSGASFTPWRKLQQDVQFSGAAQGQTVQLPWGEVSDIAAGFSASKTQIALNDFHARLLGGQIAGTVDFPLNYAGAPGGAIHGTAGYSGIDLGRIAEKLHLAGLCGSGAGKLYAVLAPDGDVTLDTRVAAQDVRYAGYHAPSIAATLHARVAQGTLTVAIPTATARTDYGAFSVTNGNYQLQHGQPGDGTLTLPLQGAQIPLQAFAQQIHGMASLQGTVSGDAASPTLAATLDVVNGSGLGRTFDHATAEMSYHANDLRFRNVALTRPGITMRLTGGETGFDPRQGIRDIPMNVTLQGAPLQEVLALFNVQSPVKIDGATSGTFVLQSTAQGFRATGGGEIPGAVVHIPTSHGDYRLALDKVGLQFDLLGRTMQISALTAQKGTTTVVAAGSASCPANNPLSVKLAFHGEHGTLQDLPQDLFGIPAPLAGPADIQGALNGVLNGSGAEPLRVDAKISSPQLTVSGIPAGTGAIDLTYLYRPNDRQLLIHPGSAVQNSAFQLTSSGTYLLSRGIMHDAVFSLDHLDLGALETMLAGAKDNKNVFVSTLARHLPAQLSGQGQATFRADGNSNQPALTLQTALTHLALASTPLPNLHADLASEIVGGKYALRINDAVAEGGNGSGRAQVSGLLDPRNGPELHFTLQGITPSAFARWTGPLPIDGQLSMAGAIHGPWQQPQADGDLQVSMPVIAGHQLQRVQAHLQLTASALTVSDGQVLLTPDSLPVSVQGEIPLQWDGAQVQFPADRPLALEADLPQQNLSLLQPLLPAMPNLQGNIAGHLRIGGTAAAPQLTDGRLAVTGSAALPRMASGYPNMVNDINVSLHVTGDARQSRVSIDHFSAVLDRLEHGRRPGDFQPGQLIAQGTVGIDMRDLLAPNSWQWNIYGRVDGMPLPQEIFQVPRASGFVRLSSVNGAPVLNGVVMADNVKIKPPKLTAPLDTSWGPFPFNPRLSIVLQIGSGVKLAKGIVRLPLQATPLPWPSLTPAMAINPQEAVYSENADMLHPGAPAELPGTWGVITGSLENPQVYARFEVNKKKLAFPFSLIGSARNARGHITYSMTDGPHVTMGIPNAPAAKVVGGI